MSSSSRKSRLLKGLRKPFKFRSSAPANSSCHISQLPTEILCDIFLNYLDLHSQDAPNHVAIPNSDLFWHRKAPYVFEYSVSDPGILAQVCSGWRKVALSYPELWSRILIIGPLSKSQVSMTKLWLERANGHPLDLTFRELPMKSKDGLANEVLRHFFEYSSTWRSIRLQVESSSLGVISTMTESCEPCVNLESAGFVIPNSFLIAGDSPLLDKTWKFFHSSPVLRKVILPPLTNQSLFPHTPTTRLTSITLWSYATMADLLLVICRCPLLEEAKTEFLTTASLSGAFGQTGTITHQSLQTLLISATYENDLDRLFATIALPSLKVLSLYHTPPFATFRDFLCRSKCQLRELTSGVQGNLEPYIRLEELSSLTVFRVTNADVTDRAIELLLLRKRNGLNSNARGEYGFVFLPHLEVIHLSTWRASDGMLSRFFAARSCVPVNLGDYMKTVLPDEPDPVSCPADPERVEGQVAFSFRPLPDGPIDSAFLKRNYEWLSEVYKWVALCRVLRAVCLQ